MNIEIPNLTEKNLIDAPDWGSHPSSCKYCLYWEFPDERTDPATESRDGMLQKKLRWLLDTWAAFGPCGKLLYVDGEAVGYAQYAPPALLPNSAQYPSGPASEDAVLISCLFIPAEKSRGLGLGTRLLQSIIEDLRQRGVKAVETFARKSNQDNPSGPAQFYLRHGFSIHRDDPEFPLMRLEL